MEIYQRFVIVYGVLFSGKELLVDRAGAVATTIAGIVIFLCGIRCVRKWIMKPVPVPVPASVSDANSSLSYISMSAADGAEENKLAVDGPKSDESVPVASRAEFLSKVNNSRRFSYTSLVRATNSFFRENTITRGRSAVVYKAVFADGPILAVKSLMGAMAENRYRAEIQRLKTFHHDNIVSLRGMCSNGDHERYLLYDFMEHGHFTHLGAMVVSA